MPKASGMMALVPLSIISKAPKKPWSDLKMEAKPWFTLSSAGGWLKSQRMPSDNMGSPVSDRKPDPSQYPRCGTLSDWAGFIYGDATLVACIGIAIADIEP